MTTYTQKILATMGRRNYVPATISEIARSFNLQGRQVTVLKKEIAEMERQGAIVRLKKDKFCLPDDADLIAGKIIFRQSGAATLIPEEQPGKSRSDARFSIRAEDTSVAMHGDHVLARLIPPGKRKPRYRKGRRVSYDLAEKENTARVIRILERARQTLTGTLKRSKMYFYVIPDDPRIIQDILVPDPARQKLKPQPKVNDKVIVRLEKWEQRHLNPEGDIIARLGKTNAPDAEHEALLHRYQLSAKFPDAVMKEVARLPVKVRDRDCLGRVDCRDLFTFTIDPDDAKDFDDALSLEKLGSGKLRIGIHIADVSAYIKSGSALDKEARARGNSTYLVGEVIPMLPKKLSNGLCSLVEAEDRLTKTVFITFSAKGKIIASELANTVIRSQKRLTYKQAYALLSRQNFMEVRKLPMPSTHQTGSTGKPLAELSDAALQQLRDAIRTLWGIASQVRDKRMKSGSLNLDMSEIKIYVDEKGYADRIVKVTNDESHQLIEEFMLLANEIVSRELSNANMPMIYRVHDKPDPEKLDELREFMQRFEIETGDLSHRKAMNKLLDAINQHAQSYILRIEILRSLKKACYRAQSDGHYGLNKKHYTHFTSPIRRYSDLIVHRIFDRVHARNNPSSGSKEKIERYTSASLARIGKQISSTEVNSTEAERESVKLKLLEFFEREDKKRKKTIFNAVITSIKNHGLFVELTDSMVFGLVHISALRDDLYKISPDGSRMTGRRKKKAYHLGQKIRVVTERVDRYKRQIDFRIV